MTIFKSTKLVIALLAIVVLSSICMFYRSFTVFPAYDDEGFCLVPIQDLLEGRVLYHDVIVIFGPFFYLVSWLTYSVLHIPLTTDAARFVNIFYWLFASVACGWCVWRVTHRSSLTILCFLAVALELRILPHGVSHPQGLAACLMSLFALAVTWLDERRLTIPWAVCAAAAGALVFTKINLGIFATLALVFSLVVGTERNGLWRVARWLTLLAAMVLPWILMRGHINDLQILLFALTMSVSALLLFLGASTTHWGSKLPNIPVIIAVYLLPGLAGCLFISMHGTSLKELFAMMVIRAAAMGDAYSNTIQTGWPELVACAVSPLALFLIMRGSSESGRAGRFNEWLRVFLKFSFPLMALTQTVLALVLPFSPYKAAAVGSFLSPLLWLAVVDPLSPAKNLRLTRLAVCSLALFEFLMAYPVAGAQRSVGSFLFIPVAAFCLADAFAWLKVEYLGSKGIQKWRSLELPLTASAAVAVLVTGVVALRAEYMKGIPLDLPGAHRLRLTEDRVALYQWMAANLEAHADTFLANTGQNSLYLWTGQRNPTRLNICHLLANYTDGEQDVAAAILKDKRRSMFIYHPEQLTSRHYIPDRDLKPLLVDSIRTDFQNRGSVNGYELWTPKSESGDELVDCGLWTGPDTFQLVLAPRHGNTALSRVSLFDLESRQEIASTDSGAGVNVSRLSIDAAAFSKLDLSETASLHVKLDQQVDETRKNKLIIRLFNDRGSCIGRLPFIKLDSTNL